MVTIYNYAGEKEWLEGRGNHIGGSDAPAVMCLDPRRTRQDLAIEKLGLRPRDVNSEAMEWGHLLEPLIRDKFRQKSGMLVDYSGPWTMCVHDEHRFMAYSPDGTVRSDDRPGHGVLQIKKDYSATPWESPPIGYLAQIQHEMFVAGLDWAVIACLFAGVQVQWYVVEKHEKFQATMLDKERAFWESIKAGKVPLPDPANDEEMAAYAKSLLTVEPGKVVELGGEFLELHHERILLNREIKEREKKVDAIKAKLQVAMGDAESAVIMGTDVRFSNPLVVKAEHLVKASKYRRFSTNQDRSKKEDANDA